MAFSLNPQTQQLVEDQMKATGIRTPDELVRIAIETMNQKVEQLYYEDLDEETRAAIEEGEAQYQQGHWKPADEVFAEIRKKYFGGRSSF